EAAFAKVEIAPDGTIALSHSGTEIGTGMSSGQAVACARWLGQPADQVELAITEWPELPVETGSSDPIDQDAQDRLAENPRWTPAFASASSASNSSYYFTHTTREGARVVFLRGLWPAALAIWGRGGSSQTPSPEDARWSDGALSAPRLPPLDLRQLA